MKLIYICGPGEGPEPKKLGGAFAKHPPIIPGIPWECKRVEFAQALIGSFPGKIVEFLEPEQPAEKSQKKTKGAPVSEPSSLQGGEG